MPTPCSHLEQLKALSAQLNLPSTPRYSVFRAGEPTQELIEATHALLRFGLRVFLVITSPLTSKQQDHLRPFILSRLLEYEVISDAASSAPNAWCVDGALDEESRAWLERADEESRGGINAKQFLVVHAPVDRDVEVQAGAGTGKTETMIERIIFLRSTLDGELELKQIGMVTFTKEAAKQMRERLIKSLNTRQRLCDRPQYPYLAWMSAVASMPISTIHSFSRVLITAYGAHLGLAHEVKVGALIMPIKRIVREQLSAHFKGPRLHEWLEVMPLFEWEGLTYEALSLLAKGGVSLSELRPQALAWGQANLSAHSRLYQEVFTDVIPRVISELAALRNAEQTLSTDDLTPKALEALQSHQTLGENTLAYLFIDEFQDTDTLQMELFQAYCERSACKLFYVGDKKQAIYRFRGAYGNAFEAMEAKQRARGALSATFTLTRNFRTGQRLLNSLNPYFARWGFQLKEGELDRLLDYQERLDRLLAAPFSRDQGDRSKEIITRRFDRSIQQDQLLDQLAIDIKQLNQDGFKEVAILVRSNHEAYRIKEHLKGEQLECALLTGGDFFQSRPVRELRSFLSAVIDPTNTSVMDLLSTSWAQGVIKDNNERSKAGKEDYKHCVLFEWPDRLRLRYERSLTAANTDLAPLKHHLRKLRYEARKVPVIAFINHCLELYQPARYGVPGVDEPTDMERQSYERSLDLLLTKMIETFGEASVSLQGLLEWLKLKIATDDSTDRPAPYEEGGDVSERSLLAAITVHRSKGQEYEAVLIPFTKRAFVRDSKELEVIVDQEHTPPQIHWRKEELGNEHPQSTLWGEQRLETIKEETRLLYVAMTRAKHRLIAYTQEGAPPFSWSTLLSLPRRNK